MSCNVRRLKLCKTLCFGSDMHQRIPAPFCFASIRPGADLLTFNLDDKQTSKSPLSFVPLEKKPKKPSWGLWIPELDWDHTSGRDTRGASLTRPNGSAHFKPLLMAARVLKSSLVRTLPWVINTMAAPPPALPSTPHCLWYGADFD